MNHCQCGQPLQRGVQICPRCGAYQPGTRSAYADEERGLMPSLQRLPQLIRASWTDPAEALRMLVDKRDIASCPIVMLLVLLFAFVSSVVWLPGFVNLLFEIAGRVKGVSMAATAASLNQGVSFVVRRYWGTMGLTAAVFQLAAMIVPTAVFTVYICAIRRVIFSWELCLGFLTMTAITTPLASVLGMLLSLLSPWLGLIPPACGAVLGLSRAWHMLGPITGLSERELYLPRMVCVLLSVGLTLLLCTFTGGLIFRSLVQQMLRLLSTVG